MGGVCLNVPGCRGATVHLGLCRLNAGLQINTRINSVIRRAAVVWIHWRFSIQTASLTRTLSPKQTIKLCPLLVNVCQWSL